MSLRLHSWVLALVVCFAWSESAIAEKRVALVVGINGYANLDADKQLQKARGDAAAVAQTLADLKFEVILREDLTRTGFNEAWTDFLGKLSPGDTAAFYFAGHGVELGGRNYLLPKDVPNIRPGRDELLKRESLALQEFLEDLRERGTRLNIVILDACRDNPFPYLAGRSVGRTRGLAMTEPPEGTFIMYSAGTGESALDRLDDTDKNPNSVFTRQLLPLLKTPGLSLTDVAEQIKLGVRNLAGTVDHRQTPAYYNQVLGKFCLVSCETPSAPSGTPILGGAAMLSGEAAEIWALSFSRDGCTLAWGNKKARDKENDYAELSEELALPCLNLKRPMGVPQQLSRPASEFDKANIKVGDRELILSPGNSVLEIRQASKKLATLYPEMRAVRHNAYTFTPDGAKVLYGGDNGALLSYDTARGQVESYYGHQGHIYAVSARPDSKVAASGGSDKIIHLWNIATREVIASVSSFVDGEWLVWTPQGYYTGSPGSDKLLAWRVSKAGRGTSPAVEYFGAEVFRNHLNRPDIVEKAIILGSAQQAVRESHGTSFALMDVLSRPIPDFRFLSPAPGSTLGGGRAEVKISITPVRDPVKAVRVQVNGRLVEEILPPVGQSALSGDMGFSVPLAKGKNDVRITLSNDIGEKAQSLALIGEELGDLDRRGTLYVLAIAVERYLKLGNICGESGAGSCDIKFASADARAWADVVERRIGPSHNKVVKRVLADGGGAVDAPTAANIFDALDILRDAKENDTTMLYIVGHGVNDGPSYRFLPTDAQLVGDTWRGATVVPWQVLQEAIEATKGRRVLFIDTAHTGNAYNQKLGNQAYHANIIAYTAARFDQFPLTDPKLGKSLFAHAVVEGLEGRAGSGSGKGLSTNQLAQYVNMRVGEMAKGIRGEQETQYFRGRDAEDYLLTPR